MQNEWLQFLLQYLFAFVATGIVYIGGNFLLNYISLGEGKNNNIYLRTYHAMVLGLVVIVLFYSLIVAHGKTINILFLPILLLLFLFNKKNENTPVINTSNKQFPWLFILGSCAFFLMIFHLLPESENQQKDATFYLRISTSLNNTGQENVFGTAALIGKPFVGTEAYHYFEIWWNAILNKCFVGFLPGMQMLRFVSYTTICATGLLGLFALTQNFISQPLTVLQKLFCVTFVFFLPDLLSFFHFLQPVIIYTFENNMIERPPLRTLYLFLPGLLIALDVKKNEWKVLFWITGAMVSSLLYTAVMFPTAVLFCLICVFKIDKKNKKPYLVILIGVVATALFYFIFYHFTQSKLPVTSTNVTLSKFIVYFLRYWKIIFFSTTTSLFTCLWLPVLLLLFIYKRNKQLVFVILNNKIITFLCVAILGGIVLARWLNFVDDVYQFAYTADACAGFLFFILLVFIFNEIKINKIAYIALSFSIFILYFIQRFVVPLKSHVDVFVQNGEYVYNGEKFSDKYLDQIKNAFQKGSNIKGAFWADAGFYDTIFHHSYRNSNVFLLPTSYILESYADLNYEFCLSDSAAIIHNIDRSEQIPFNYVSASIVRSVFYRYSIQEIGSDTEKKLSFIKENKLQYLILTRNADTTIITQLPVLKRFQDDVTGERFYIIAN